MHKFPAKKKKKEEKMHKLDVIFSYSLTLSVISHHLILHPRLMRHLSASHS